LRLATERFAVERGDVRKVADQDSGGESRSRATISAVGPGGAGEPVEGALRVISNQ